MPYAATFARGDAMLRATRRRAMPPECCLRYDAIIFADYYDGLCCLLR